MRVIIAAGGTGGHIYPGIAIAREFKRRDANAEILFVGTPRGLESKIVPREGFTLEMISVGALKSVSVIQRGKSLLQLPTSFLAALKILKRFKPDIVVTTCRTSGETVDAIAAYGNKGFDVLWTSTYESGDPNLHPELNRVKGEHIFDLLKKLGRL